MGDFRRFDHSYVNARADECLTVMGDRGERIVRYRGGVFTVIGYYLAWGIYDERVLCYVLRAPRRIAETQAVS